MTVKRSPFSKSTVNKVIKEKFIFGDVLDGPSPKSRLSQFDKLSLELKDKIRKTVSRYIVAQCGNLKKICHSDFL